MRTKMTLLGSFLAVGICLTFTMGNAQSKVPLPEKTFSFRVLTDLHSSASWRNALQEIHDRKTTTDTSFTPAEFVLVSGDISPQPSYEVYKQVFADTETRPVLLPVIGNHDLEGKDFPYVRDVLIPSITNAVRRHATSCDYFFDHRNVRIIAVDGYTDLGKNGVINDEGRKWVEETIKATPSSIKHIFVSIHEPAFPRGRHIGDSFDQDPEKRNAFWLMLLKYRDRVRAVFVGHTHSAYRMRVLDPAGKAASDTNSCPDEVGGIYQISAGRSSTIVQVQIEGTNVLFSILKARAGSKQSFAEGDKWRIGLQP